MSEKCRVANVQCSPQGDASLNGFGASGSRRWFPDGSRQGDAASDNDVCVGPQNPTASFTKSPNENLRVVVTEQGNHWLARSVDTPDGYPRRVREAAELAKYR